MLDSLITYILRAEVCDYSWLLLFKLMNIGAYEGFSLIIAAQPGAFIVNLLLFFDKLLLLVGIWHNWEGGIFQK